MKLTNRPYMNFSIIPEERILYMIIQNIGNRIAENVKIYIVPPLESNEVKNSFFTDKLSYPSFPPNYQFKMAFDFISPEEGKSQKKPDKYNVHITYCFESKNYDEEYDIDYSMFKNKIYFKSN